MNDLLLQVRRKEGKIQLAPMPVDSGEVESVTMYFGESEKKTLKTYLERCARLRLTLKPFEDFNLHLSAKVGDPVVLQANLPSVAEINSFLMEMRPFILVKESTYYNKVSNLISRGLPIRELQLEARNWRRAFEKPDLGFTLNMDGVVINSVQGLDTWLYGDKFHIDEEKRETWTGWTNSLGDEFAIGLVLNVMLSRTLAIQWLESPVAAILEAYRNDSSRLDTVDSGK